MGSTSRVVSLGLRPIGALLFGALIDASNGTVATAVMGASPIAVALVAALIPTLRAATPEGVAPDAA